MTDFLILVVQRSIFIGRLLLSYTATQHHHSDYRHIVVNYPLVFSSLFIAFPYIATNYQGANLNPS